MSTAEEAKDRPLANKSLISCIVSVALASQVFITKTTIEWSLILVMCPGVVLISFDNEVLKTFPVKTFRRCHCDFGTRGGASLNAAVWIHLFWIGWLY